jgi:PKD repeat protein
MFGVSLQVGNAAGADTELKSSLVTVTVPPTTGPIAEFTGSPLSGVEPLTTAFQFVDVRAGAVTYTNFEWDFTSNGTYDATGATLTSTSHTYSTSGSYDVTLRVTDNTGAQSTLTKAVYVIVGRRTCTVPDFFNTKRNDAQSRWAAAGFTTTVITQPPKNGGGNANYNIGYQSIVGGLIDPQPAGCASVITVGP